MPEIVYMGEKPNGKRTGRMIKCSAKKGCNFLDKSAKVVRDHENEHRSNA